jgi:hypothetical protein
MAIFLSNGGICDGRTEISEENHCPPVVIDIAPQHHLFNALALDLPR